MIQSPSFARAFIMAEAAAMPIHCLKACILSCLALAVPPVHASAQQLVAKTYADAGGWRIESYRIGRQHMRCGAIAPAGTMTIFEKSREGWTVVVPTQAKGDTLQGLIDIDGRRFRGPFHRMDDDRVGFFLKLPQLRPLRAGKAMNVRIDGEQTSVPLAGSASVFHALAACDEKGGA